MSNPLSEEEIAQLRKRGLFHEMFGESAALTGVLKYLTGNYTVHKGLVFQHAADFEDGSVVMFRNEETNEFNIGTTNNPVATIHTDTVNAVNMNITSDIRLKTDIHPVLQALERMDGIGTYRYQIREQEQIGFLAQEIERIYPEIISEDPDTGLKRVNYNSMTAVLWKCAKELKYQSQESEQRIRTLEKTLKTTQEEVKELREFLRSYIQRESI